MITSKSNAPFLKTLTFLQWCLHWQTTLHAEDTHSSSSMHWGSLAHPEIHPIFLNNSQKKKKKKNWLRQTIGELSHTSCQCTDVLLFSSQFHSRDGCYMLCQLSHRQQSQKLQDAPIPQNVFIPKEKYEADLKVRFDPQSAKYPCF